MSKLLLLTALVTAGAIGLGLLCGSCSHGKEEIPQLPEKFNWKKGATGDGDKDTSIRPFKIKVSDEILKDLKNRLVGATRLTDPLEDAAFTYGFNVDFLKKIQKFWLNDYKWKEREALLNKYDQFMTTIEGLDIHFYHVKPKAASGKKVLPLLLLHGWPGSIVEFQKAIPLLTTVRPEYDFVFELIIPSLPGYGFSSPAEKKGMGILEMGKIFRKLMDRLGHQKFYVQGGDWGSFVATSMGILYPERVQGLHLNMCVAMGTKSFLKQLVGTVWSSPWMTQEESTWVYPLGEKFGEVLLEMGYMHLHATKPDTVGVALNDSPLGLAAYILEKFSTWTNKEWRNLPDGGLPGPYTLEELLDNIMVYWVTGSFTSSARLYKENFGGGSVSPIINNKIVVPTSCAVFPNELSRVPENFIRDVYVNLTRFTTMPRGGHFAAFEQPQILVDDVWKSVNVMKAQ